MDSGWKGSGSRTTCWQVTCRGLAGKIKDQGQVKEIIYKINGQVAGSVLGTADCAG